MSAKRAAGFQLLWLAIGFALTMPALCKATVLYVSPAGSDFNTGLQTQPFRQIRAALAAVHPGDTVLVSDGTYLGFDVDNVQGLPGQPIIIQATGANVNVVPTTDRTDNRDTIFVTYSSFVVLDGLNSFNANRAAIRIDHSTSVTVRNGVYGANAVWGVYTDFSDNLLIEHNECYGSVTQHGIYVANSCVNPTVRGNKVHDNYGSGIHMNGGLDEGGTGLITGGLIEGNVIYNNGAGGGAGINMDGVQTTMLRNNLFFNNHSTGIAMFQIDGAAGPQGNQVLHNTFDMASDARWGLLISNTTGLNTVRNNILLNRNTAHGGLLYRTAADAGNVDSDYNIMDSITTDDGDTKISLASWQAQGHELHSRSATLASLFVNPAAGDYHLAAGAPAIDTGATLFSVTSDLDNNPRPQGAASDIGCYESAGSAVVVPPPPTITLTGLTVSPASVKGGATVTGVVTLSGQAPAGGAVVALSKNGNVTSMPASVTVPAGQTTASFSIKTTRVKTSITVTITANYAGGSKSASLKITR